MSQMFSHRPRTIMTTSPLKQSTARSVAFTVKPVLLIPFILLVILFLFQSSNLSDSFPLAQQPVTDNKMHAELMEARPVNIAMSEPENVDAKPVSVQEKHARFCDYPGDCIFDLGHNTGQDTKLYLESPNARVVAVEANPDLIEASKEKFSVAIASGRLRLISVGLAGSEADGGKKTFWVNAHSKFSSFLETLGCRDGWGKVMPEGDHTNCHTIRLDVRSCKDLIKEFGTPVYLKIDIEGLDRVCVESVGFLPREERPQYISVENVQANVVELMAELGYTGFKAVNQAKLELGTTLEMRGNSGPWGEKAVDDVAGIQWQTKEQMLERLPLNGSLIVDGEERVAWYDLHAKQPL